jgi:hypothetical protein
MGNSTVGLKQSDDVTRGTISTGDLIGKIFTKTFFVGVIAPLLFAYLGSASVLVSLDAQSQWLVSKLAWVWPVLPTEYEVVRQVQGAGQSVSFGFMCAGLWAWPVICSVAYLRAHVKRKERIRPISPKEIGALIMVFPVAVLVLVFDVTRVASPLFGFLVHHATLLYLRQWFVFAPTAFVLGFLLYSLGRVILEQTWERSD